MTDWTPAARLWLWGVFMAGAVAIALAVLGLPGEIAGGGVGWGGLLVLCVALGLLSFEIPGDRTYITPSETVAFLAVLLYGPSVAALAGAAEGYLTVRRVRRSHWYSALFSAGTMAISLYAAGLFYRLTGGQPLGAGVAAESSVVVPLLVMAAVHYFMNTGIVAAMVRLRRPGTRTLLAYWLAEYGFAAITYLGSAWLAVLLVLAGERFGWTSLLGAIPLLVGVMYLLRLHTGRKLDELRHREELGVAYRQALMTLAQAIDARDEFGHGHVFRVQSMALRVAARRGLGKRQTESLAAAALLHDIGKLAVPDYVVNKRGALIEEEAGLVRSHPSVGADLLRGVSFPEPLLPAVLHHHEAWDGSGFPDGLAGEAIPVAARILSVVDEYDRLRCDGPCRSGLSEGEALRVMRAESGKKFDPALVLLLESCTAEIEAERDPSEEWTRWRPGAEESQAFATIAAAQRDSRRLLEALQDLGVSLDVDETLALVARHVKKLAPDATGVLYLVRREGDELEAVHAWGTDTDALVGYRIGTGIGLAGRALSSRHAVIGGNPEMDLPSSDRSADYVTGAALPLSTSDGTVQAIIGLYATHGGVIPDTVERSFGLIATKAAEAICNARRFDEVQAATPLEGMGVLPAPTDTLARLDADLAYCRERVMPLAVTAVRLRGLESIELRAGARVSRQVTEEIAALLRRLMSPTDWIGWGPESHMVIVRAGAERREAGLLVENIDQEVTALRCVAGGGHIIRVDPAIGSAQHPEDGSEAGALLALALDRASAAPLHDADSGAVVNLKTIS